MSSPLGLVSSPLVLGSFRRSGIFSRRFPGLHALTADRRVPVQVAASQQVSDLVLTQTLLEVVVLQTSLDVTGLLLARVLPPRHD